MNDKRTLHAERWKPEESAAAAYLRADQIILHGGSITSIGILDCEPYRVLDAFASDAELGTALLEVLAVAKVAPPPTDLKSEQQKLFASVGAQSWKQFNKSVVYCHIGLKPERITILPTRNEGRTFFHVPEQSLKLPKESTPEQFGKALRDGFLRCT